MSTILRCRKCQSNDLERIKRNPFIKTLFPWLRMKRYRCLKCGKNAYYPASRFTAVS